MPYPSISKAVEGFLLFKSAGGLSHNTIRDYRSQLKRFAGWMNDIPVDEVDSKQIEQFMNYLREDHRIRDIAGVPIEPRKLSAKTLRNVWATLSVFWKWTAKEFEIENPFNLTPIKAHTKPVYPLKQEELSRVVKACKVVEKHPKQRKSYSSHRSTFKRDKAIVFTLLDTGVRASELCGISVEDIDLESGRIFVTGKGNKSRFVYLGKISKQAIWKYLASRFPDSNPPPDEPVFVNYLETHRLTRWGLLILMKRLGERADVANVHPHRFRHTFAIEFLRNGGNVFELQQLLGHSDLAMVKRYVRLAQVDLEVVARKASPADNWRL